MTSIQSSFPNDHHHNGDENGQSNGHRGNFITPHHNDVLLGRGGKNREHIGNQNLKDVARRCSNLYSKAARKDKPHIASEIVKKIGNLNPSGRFLKQDPITLEWHEVPNEVAQEKVSQCLRDVVSSRRRQIKILSRQNDHYQTDQSPRIGYFHPTMSLPITLATLTDIPTLRFVPRLSNTAANEIQKWPTHYKIVQDESPVQLSFGTYKTTDFIPETNADVNRPKILSEVVTHQEQGECHGSSFHGLELVESASRFENGDGQQKGTNKRFQHTISPCPVEDLFVDGDIEDISIAGDCIDSLAENFDFATVFENHDLKESSFEKWFSLPGYHEYERRYDTRFR